MDELPERAAAIIEEYMSRSGARGRAARRIREDFRDHFLDGLSRGRSLDELIEAFGDPARAAALLDSTPDPPSPAHPQGAGLRGVLDGLLMDLRLSLRTIRHGPVFALTVAAVLAIGIGANAVTFTLVNEVLLRPLPVHDQETLVHVLADVPGGNSFTGFSVGDFRDLRSQNDVLRNLLATTATRVPLGDLPTSDRVVVSIVSSDYFEVLGVGAHMGTVRLPAFTGWGTDPVVVVSHAFWQGRLGGSPDVVGSTLRVNDATVTVIGVASPPFRGTFIGFPTDMWTPLSEVGSYRSGFTAEDREGKFLELMGRRRPAVSEAEVQAELNEIARRIEAAHPEVNRGHRVRVVAVTGIDESLRVGVHTFTAILTLVAGLVLLVACLNVGGILLVRAMTREREIAIRLAVGAGSRRLLAQMTMETALLAAAATALALGLAAWATAVLRDFVAAASGGLGLDLRLDWRVLGLTAAASLLAAFLASLVPSLHIARRDPAGVLRERGTSSGGTHRVRATLVVTQVALSVLLAISSGLFVRALSAGLEADPGFDADRVASVSLQFDPDRYGPDQAIDLQDEIVRQVASLPGIDAVALSASPPIGVARTPGRVVIPGVEHAPDEMGFPLDVRTVGSGYFETLGVELLRGDPIGEVHDAAPVRVAVVSQAFVERFFPGETPLGRTVEVDREPIRIVGVARDVRYILQDDSPDPLIYLSFGGRLRQRGTVLFRTQADPVEFVQSIGMVVSGVAPDLRRVEVRTVRETLSDGLLPQRVGAAVIGVMGLIALVLASVGLYGLVQYTVSRDLRSVGVRMALGGGRLHIMRSVLKRGFLLTTLGMGIGVGLAAALTPGIRPFLIGVSTWDPATYATVVLAFALVSLVACFGPALRASRVDPGVSLRAE